MKRPQKITMKMVAKEAGVSIQTVSRVVNYHPDVAESTKNRVRAVMERLNYMPNVVARCLSSQRSMMIGAVVESMQDLGPRQILAGIFYGCDQNDYCTLIKELETPSRNDIEAALQSLRSRQVDGIIWAIAEIDDYRSWMVEYCKEKIDVPMLFLTADESSQADVFYLTNYDGAYEATKHLIEQGYRHIGHIAGRKNWLVSERRRQGWEDALKDAGMAPEENALVYGDWTPESGIIAFQQLIRQYPQMDGLFAANDHMAISSLNLACKMKIRVPQDLGIVGYDDIFDAKYYSPSLTTVHQDFKELGFQTVAEMVNILQGKELSGPVGIHSKLVIRESTARSKTIQDGD